MLVGALRPAILLPLEMLGEPRWAAAIRPILAHELAHVCRRDLVWSGLAGLVRAVFFFHPLVWLAHREALVAREAACDALALRASGTRPSEYGRLLLEIARSGPKRPFRWTSSLGMAGSTGSLKRRIKAMQRIQHSSRQPLVAWALALMAVGPTMLIPWQLVPREAIAQDSPAVGIPQTKQSAGAERPARLLYLVGPTTSFDLRYLIRGLSSAKEIKIDAYSFKMAGALDNTELIPARYDAYVLEGLPAAFLTKAQQLALVKAVEGGAGLILVGGRASYAGGGWGRSELVRLFPAQVGTEPDWMEPAGGVRVIPKPGKLSTSFLELGPNAEQSARIWAGLPPLAEMNRLGALKPSALLFASTDSGDPFLVGQEVGKGRVLAIAGEIWPWARHAEESKAAHRLFWERAIQWAGHRDRMVGNPKV
jgi:BlaR1 peptidase M56